MNLRPFLLLTALLLGACATAPDSYPSLAIRDAERVTGTMAPPPPAYVPPPTPEATLGRLDGIAAEALETQASFDAEAEQARRVVAAARGANPGEENWSRAQVAVAGLEAARSRVLLALADIDRLAVDTRLEGGELTRIAAAQDQLSAQVQAQNAVIAELLGRLRQ